MSKLATSLAQHASSTNVSMASTEDEKLAQEDSTSQTSISSIHEISKCTHYCHRVVRSPVVLPCGHSGCQICLQTQHLREAAFLRPTPGTTCRCRQCGKKHTDQQYNVDVTTNKIVNLLRCTVLDNIWEAPHHLEIYENVSEKPVTAQPENDNLATTANKLDNHSLKQSGTETNNFQSPLDPQTRFRQSIGTTVECPVCYSILTEPTTTPCGHTFCHRCLIRVLDHGRHCPVCRRYVDIPKSGVDWPRNSRLDSILTNLFPSQTVARAEAVCLEEAPVPPGFDIPLFICMLSYPKMATFLFVFEPRYRLMLRRIMMGNQQFGMVSSSQPIRPIETSNLNGKAMDAAGFCEFGTVLHVEHLEVLDDGTSIVSARGSERFQLLDFTTRDGYYVGKTIPVKDCSEQEEQRIETEDVITAKRKFESLPADVQQNVRRCGTSFDVEHNFSSMELLTNEELVKVGHDFVKRMQYRGVESCLNLGRNAFRAFGPPPSSPDIFPFWFAAVANEKLPRKELYPLLTMTSRRERLLHVGKWINNIDQHTSTASNSCSIF